MIQSIPLKKLVPSPRNVRKSSDVLADLQLRADIAARGLLQNLVQPIAFGATLDISPLVVLVMTIAGGSLFGMVGMVLAAPLTSAAVHIGSEVRRHNAERRGSHGGEVAPAPG